MKRVQERWEETKANFLGLTRFTIVQSAKVNDKSAVFFIVALALLHRIPAFELCDANET